MYVPSFYPHNNLLKVCYCYSLYVNGRTEARRGEVASYDLNPDLLIPTLWADLLLRVDTEGGQLVLC